MKTYRVDFWLTEYGTATNIEAESKEEAEKWLYDEIAQNGLDEVEYRLNDREYGTQSADEVKLYDSSYKAVKLIKND